MVMIAACMRAHTISNPSARISPAELDWSLNRQEQWYSALLHLQLSGSRLCYHEGWYIRSMVPNSEHGADGARLLLIESFLRLTVFL
jgi:hypothetical protein